ncbi:glutaredoxin family protein [Desulforegula conservatrix]|uniref:glutaredoxin family protein n=1 Tax=Desulforegula conservatrix TaxID=153026 RepID=UPI0003FBC35C
MRISNIKNMIHGFFSSKTGGGKPDPKNHGIAASPLKKEENIMGEENKNSDVTIYSLSTCSHCKAAKKFIGDCAVKYEFIDVDMLDREERMAILEDVRKVNPRCSFPTIVIGDKVVVGFREDQIKEALGL